MVIPVAIFRGKPPVGTVAGPEEPVTAWTVPEGHRGILKSLFLRNDPNAGSVDKAFSMRIVPSGVTPDNDQWAY